MATTWPATSTTSLHSLPFWDKQQHPLEAICRACKPKTGTTIIQFISIHVSRFNDDNFICDNIEGWFGLATTSSRWDKKKKLWASWAINFHPKQSCFCDANGYLSRKCRKQRINFSQGMTTSMTNRMNLETFLFAAVLICLNSESRLKICSLRSLFIERGLNWIKVN